MAELCARAPQRPGALVRAHVRPDSPRASDWRARFEAQGAEVDTTAWDPAALAGRLVELAPTHVFALFGTTRARARAEGRRPADAYRAVDVELTRALCAAAAACPAPPRLVYLSSMGASAGARGAYLRARWEAEELVRASGLPYTIARPSLVTGPDRDEARPLERYSAALARPLARLLSRCGAPHWGARLAPTDARELAHGLVHAAFNYTTINRVLEAEELRYLLANDREHHVPATQRDGRH